TGGLLESRCKGVTELEQAIRKHPELFVRTLTENLLMFGQGRVIDERDAPAIRKVVHQARATDYRFSSLVVGIVQSVPFRMRRTE
ncbi:MAG: Protein of unknown function (DUF1587)/Protein of unknown function (DUF1592)/Protein of unknown, partial [Chthonomonadales bacterium]|nr:Protein of unknown function (DUF1587)/Protein of unknown function (DUF1592)/Protein of unknown [Chthonomonadales bacterium]